MNRLLRQTVAVAALLAPLSAQAQQQFPTSSTCARLEAQLQSVDRSAADSGRADQIRRLEDTAANQQSEIDRQTAQAKRMGCEQNSFFVLFSSQPQQCGPLNARIQQLRASLDRVNADLERLRTTGSAEHDTQRRTILAALAQNNCGPQYRAAAETAPARSGNIFDTLFGGGGSISIAPPTDTGGWNPPGGTYRTVCVRTCDGFYYPISFATDPGRFAEDEKSCRRSCPAAETMLFTHRNPGEDMSHAVSAAGGQPYSALPNAFRYRQGIDATCSCRRPGESWAHALKDIDDTTLEQGDIVVNEQRSRQMSLPRTDAQGRPIRPDPTRSGAPASTAPASSPAQATGAPAAETPTVKPDPNRSVRSVGPPFLLPR